MVLRRLARTFFALALHCRIAVALGRETSVSLGTLRLQYRTARHAAHTWLTLSLPVTPQQVHAAPGGVRLLRYEIVGSGVP